MVSTCTVLNYDKFARNKLQKIKVVFWDVTLYSLVES